MNSNPTTLSVDEQIDEILQDMDESLMYGEGVHLDYYFDTDDLDKSIKSLIRQVCEEVIGKDELQGMMSPLQWEIAQDRNYLRNEQRTKLNNLLWSDK